MPYTFELTFTGLCVFTIGGDDPWHPKEVNALLVDATQADLDRGAEHKNDKHTHAEHHHHVPLLTCWPENVVPGVPGDFRLAPTPDGHLIALCNLKGKALTIELPESARKGLVLNWNYYQAGPKPEGQAQEDWIDWTTPLMKVYPRTPPPTAKMPYAGLKKGAVTALVKLEHGELTAAEFPRIRESDEYARWEFKAPEEDSAKAKKSAKNNHVQALAGVVSLRVPGLREGSPVRICSSGAELISLEPSPAHGNVVRVSVTNLLNREPQGPPSETLKHYNLLKKLVHWRPQHGQPKLPTKEGGAVTSGNSFCPPLFYTQPREK
jgi:hypothetical protein